MDSNGMEGSDGIGSNGEGPNGISNGHLDEENEEEKLANGEPVGSGINEATRKRLESTSLMTHPVRDEDLLDFHQHRLLPGYDKLDITYSLYAAVVRLCIWFFIS